MVMSHWVQGGDLQHIEEVVAQIQTLAQQLVNMSFKQVNGFEVVGAEHQHILVLADEWVQGVKVAGGAAFADDDFHAQGYFLFRLRQTVDLMVGGDAGGNIFFQLFACDERCVAIHGLSQTVSCFNLGQTFGILVHHSGKVHHLGQGYRAGVFQQFCHSGGIQDGTGRTQGGGGYARGHGKTFLERACVGFIQHETYPFFAAHIGDFVRVGDSGDSAVAQGHAGILVGWQHRAFDVVVRIHKTRHNVLLRNGLVTVDRYDGVAFKFYRARENLPPDNVHNLSFNFHCYVFLKCKVTYNS